MVQMQEQNDDRHDAVAMSIRMMNVLCVWRCRPGRRGTGKGQAAMPCYAIVWATLTLRCEVRAG